MTENVFGNNEVWSADDVAFMRRALDLVARQVGQTGPNPAVGCVIVRHGQVLGEGVTAVGGRPHGEAVALAAAGDASGATLYVTLEPCAHQSPRGPACCQSIVDAGIARVVACLQDPDPRTAGRGFEYVRAAAIKVEIGLLADIARPLMADFFARFE